MPVSAFSPSKLFKDGYTSRCKPCRAAQERERRARLKAENPDIYKSEEHRQRTRSYRAANREHVRDVARARYADNPEKQLAYDAAYRKRHPDRVKAKNHRPESVEARRDYMRRHPELPAIYTSNYRARKRNAGGEHTWQDVLEKMEAQGGLCQWCGRDYGPDYEVDHVVPVSRGGSNGAENIAVACFDCNRIKNAKIPPEILMLGGSYH
jgi:5-methylcytosine-specific restriction endonuclease McrA